MQGSCPICRLGEVEFDACSHCKTTFCDNCGGVEHGTDAAKLVIKPCACRMDYDALEEAGHELVLITGMLAGVSTYYCENCGALVQCRNLKRILFHVPRGSKATSDKCLAEPVRGPREIVMRPDGERPLGTAIPPYDTQSLKYKLQVLEQKAYERLKEI